MDADAETGIDVVLLTEPLHGHQYQVEVVHRRALHRPVDSARDELGKDAKSLNSISACGLHQCGDLLRLTSFLTAAGSNALLILQPRTGVAGWAEWAMLSSLLNMSDSVPPAQKRFSTMSHLFRFELRGM